ncbi:MAG: DMT family transporter [Thermodesulfobacteriota bacterium]
MQRLVASGYFFVIIAALGFSFKSILAKFAYGYGVDAMTLMLMRVSISVPLILITLFWVEGRGAFRVTAKEVLLLAFMGIVGLGCAMLFSFYSLELIDASLSTLVVYTYPALTVAMLLFFYKEKAGPGKLISLAITFMGLVMVVRADHFDFLALNIMGVVFALIAAFSFAVYNVLSEKALKHISPIRVTAYCMVFLGGFFGLLFQGGPYPADFTVWGLAALLAIFSGFLPFILFLYGIKRIGAARTSIVGSIGPVFTVLWAYMLLGERLDTVQLSGMAMVVLGVMTLKLADPLRLAVKSGVVKEEMVMLGREDEG